MLEDEHSANLGNDIVGAVIQMECGFPAFEKTSRRIGVRFVEVKMEGKERLFLAVGRCEGAIHMSYEELVRLTAMLLKLE